MATLLGLLVLGFGSGCDAIDRAAALEEVGAELGLVYRDVLSASPAASIRAMPSVRGRAQNFFVRALESGDLLAFDWVQREGRLKDRDRESQTVIAVRTQSPPLPSFVWSKRGRIDRSEQRKLGEPVDFAGAEPFSDEYEVRALDRAGVRALFSDALRQEVSLPDGLRVEGAGDWWIGYRPGHVIEPSDLPAAIEEMRRVVRAFE